VDFLFPADFERAAKQPDRDVPELSGISAYETDWLS
jgi:hypothetical protein